MWAAIIGKRLPRATMIGAATPVSDDGSTRCCGTDARDRRSASLNQWTRKRLSGSGASGSTLASRACTPSGMVVGSESWAKVGIRIFASRKRWTARS